MNDVLVEDAFEHFQKVIPPRWTIAFKKALREANDDRYERLMQCQIVSPTKTLLFSIFLGLFGVDRFYMKETASGVVKIFLGIITFGVFTLFDIFFSHREARKKNYTKLMIALT